jgi:pyruvate,water dikinase
MPADRPVKIMMNVGNPDRAFDFARLPNAGVGLARLEFIINRMIGVHPKACWSSPARTPGNEGRRSPQMAGYADPVEFYVDRWPRASPPSPRPSRRSR